MRPIERILATVDFSSPSDQALRAAFYLTEKVKGKLWAMHVVSQAPFDGHFFGSSGVELMNQIESEASRELQSRVMALGQSTQETNLMVKVGVPYVDLIRFARQQKIQFIIAGTHGRVGWERTLLGSVAETLIRKSEVPVWVVKKDFSPPKKILLLTDLSEAARAGFHLGLFLAKLFGASVHLLHVSETSYIPNFVRANFTEHELKFKEALREEFQKWIEEAKVSKVELSAELREGKVSSEIEKVISEKKTDLLVLSTHGQSGLSHKHLGSVTTHLARHAACSVITVRPDSFKYREI